MTAARLTGTAAAFLATALLVDAAAACTLTFGWAPNPPFEIEAAGGTAAGIDVELLTTATAAAGCSLAPRRLPHSQLPGAVERGEVDIELGVPAPDRPNHPSLTSAAYRRSEQILFLRRGETARLGGNGLAGLGPGPFRLGVTPAADYGAEFATLRRDPAFARRLVETANADAALDLLLAGTIDGFIEDGMVALAAIKRRGLGGRIELYSPAIRSEGVVFLFNRRTVAPPLVAAIDHALHQMLATGGYDRILARYLK
ncbi:MAG: transporter substrate-binding domain-containing protein [Azospirillum sp.]|nr:transporter substrate-binding domain-containing protein [Azospirillum sp.]